MIQRWLFAFGLLFYSTAALAQFQGSAGVPGFGGITGASISPPSSFNGGLSQMNMSQLGNACCTFINMAKTMANYTVNQGSENGLLLSPSLQTVDGYPTDIPAGATGFRANAPRPNPSERGSTPIVVRWNGTWTYDGSSGTAVSNAVTAANNSATVKLTIGAPHYYRAGQRVALSTFAAPFTTFNGNTYTIASVDTTSITLTGANSSGFGAYVSGGTITNSLVSPGATGGRYVFTPAESATPNVQFSFTKAGSTPPTVIEGMYVDDEADYDAGEVFTSRFKSLLRTALRVGKLRFLDWQGGSSGANNSNTTAWASLKSESYISYYADEWKPSLWVSTVTAGSDPITSATSSINDYAITFGSGNWADKQTVQLRFPSNPTSVQTTITVSGTVGSGDLVINWTAHGMASGTPITCNGVSANATMPQPISFATNTYVGTVVDANSFKVSLTSGGADVVRTSAGAGTLACTRSTTLSLNGNTPVPIRNPYGDMAVGTSQSGTAPSSGTYSTLVYDADLNSLLLNRSTSFGAGLINGVPPSLMFRLCKEVGAHCYFVSPVLAVDPMSDYVTQLMTACRDYAAASAPWMICGIEGVNETWNSGTAFNGTRYAWNKSYAHWPDAASSNASFDSYNWYGKIISTVGQATQAVFSNDRSKYEVYLGLRTADCDLPSLGDARVNATKYLAQSAPAQAGYCKAGCEPYKYATHGVVAGYISPDDRGFPPEMSLGYDYAINGNAAALQTYIDTLPQNTLGRGNIVKGGLRIAACKTYMAGPWGGSFVLGLQGYEGGYDNPDPSGSSSSIATAATNDASGAVLTMPTALINGNPDSTVATNSPTNAAMAGMVLTTTTAAGGAWTTLNSAAQTVTITPGSADIPYTGNAVIGQAIINFTAANASSTLPSNIATGTKYWIVSVNAGVSIQVSTSKGGAALVPSGGTGTATMQPGWVVSGINVDADPLKVRIDVDSSGLGTATFTASTPSFTFSNGTAYLTAIRRAGRAHSAMQAYTWGGAVSSYKNWTDVSATFPPQYYSVSGLDTPWGIYEPSTYSTPSPAAAGIAAFNHQ